MLNWILIIELALLAILAIIGLVGMIIARQDASDPISRFCSTFWREFLWPPQVMSIDSPALVARDTSGAAGAVRRASPDDEPSDEDAFYGRVRKDESGRNLKADLIVLVTPNASSDAVLGRDGDGLHVQVTGEPGESQANKALIEMVAGAIGIKPYQVTLTKGHYQSRKIVQIQGLSPEELRAKLSLLAEVE